VQLLGRSIRQRRWRRAASASTVTTARWIEGSSIFSGWTRREFLNIVKTARGNSGIEAYAKVFVAKKDAESIETLNQHWLSDMPTGDSLEAFYELRAKVAPGRTDVTSWPDLLDLEEGRAVPQR